MAPGQIPYLIQVTLTDTDNSTALANTKVILRDINLKEELTKTTNASGIAVFNLADFAGSYANADIIHANSFKVNYNMGGDGYRTVVNTGVGWESISMYTTNYASNTAQWAHINQITVTATTATAGYIIIYERASDSIVDYIRVAASLTVPVFYGESPGKLCNNGYTIVRSANTITVSLVSR